MEIVDTNRITPEGTKIDFKKEQTLEKLYRVMKQKQIVKVKVDQVRQAPINQDETTYVWKVDFDGINGIVQFADSGLDYENQMKQFVGQEIFVTVKKVKRNPAYVIGDRKSAVDILSEQLFQQLNEGKVIESVVKGIGNNELYVDIGGGYIIGMNRKQTILSSARKSLRRFFHIGQKLKVKVLSIDKVNKKVEVSHVDTLKNPWDMYKFTRKDVVMAEIVNITSNKVVFAEVEHGLDAIVTMPEVPVNISVGDEIQGTVTKFDPLNKRFRIRFKHKVE